MLGFLLQLCCYLIRGAAPSQWESAPQTTGTNWTLFHPDLQFSVDLLGPCFKRCCLCSVWQPGMLAGYLFTSCPSLSLPLP